MSYEVKPISVSYGSLPILADACPNPTLYEVDAAQKHMLGRRSISWDGRVFKYSRSAGACHSGCGAINNVGPYIADDGATALSVTALAGESVIQIASKIAAKDVLVGGFVIIYPYGVANEDITQFRGIVGNTYASTTTLTIYLDGPLTVNCVHTTSKVAAYYSPYYSLLYSNLTHVSTLGVPAAYVSASGKFFWLQTWGPCRCTPGEGGYGADDGERQMVFGNNGALFSHNGARATTLQYQHAGFVIPRTNAGDDAPLVMLQISI